jgi:hypothetical protein
VGNGPWREHDQRHRGVVHHRDLALGLAAMTYTFAVTDLSGNTPGALGEVGEAHEAQYKPRLKGKSLANFTLSLDHPLMTEVLSRAGDVLCKVYRDTVLELVAELLSLQIAGRYYNYVLSRETLCNVAFANAGAGLIPSQDDASIAARGMFQDIIPADPGDVMLYKALLDMNVRVRATAKREVTFERAAAESGPTVTMTFQNAARFRLERRLVGTIGESQAMIDSLAPGTDDTSANTVTYLGVPRGSIVTGLTKYTKAAHDTGIRLGTIDSTLYPIWAAVGPQKSIAEALDEFAAALVPFPVSDPTHHVGADDFSAPGSAFNLTGSTSDIGGLVWVGAGDADDFVVQPTGGGAGYATRVATGDTAGVGRRVTLNVNLGSGAIQTDFFYSIDAGFPASCIQGVEARADDSVNNRVFGWVVPNTGVASVYKVIGGTPTLLKSTGGVLLSPGITYQMRLLIDDAGYYALWITDLVDGPLDSFGPIIQGTDSDLASTGTLASGDWGLYDEYTSAAGANLVRYYDNLWISQGGPPQEFTYDLVAHEPAVDTGSAAALAAGLASTQPGLQIATLNASATIGSVKPDVIFDGAHSGPTCPRYGYDYGLGDTVTLQDKNSDGSLVLNSPVRVYGVDITQDKEQKITEVPIAVEGG